LDPAEDFILVKKYGDDARHPGMMNYRVFCQAVDVGTCSISTYE